jgi:hypothetical protein
MSAWRKRQIIEQQTKLDKEEFLIQWVLTRASFRGDGFDGTAAARSANDVWNEIQRLKDKHE